MTRQRRNHLDRMKQKRIRRCAVRSRVEQLENRVLPGGFLDLLAGAAIASTFDLLPEEPMLQSDLEAGFEVTSVQDRSAATALSDTLLKNALTPHDVNLERKERVERNRTDDDLDFTSTSTATTSTATTKPLIATSLVDSFFAGNPFVDTPSVNIAPHSPPAPTSVRALGSPISQLGAGVGSGSGQGYNVTGAASPQPGAGNSASAAIASPAHLVAEGEDYPTDAYEAINGTGDGAGDGEVSGTGVVVEPDPYGEYQKTYFTCINLPTRAAPDVFYREAGSLINIDNPSFQPTVHTLNDAADEGVIIGTPGMDETQDFPLPTGLPFVDDSFTPWLEVTSYKHWEEYHVVMARANGNPIKPLVHSEVATISESYTTSNAISTSVEVSRQIGAAAEIEVVNIESALGGNLSLSHEFIYESSSGRTFEQSETIDAAPCQTAGLYQEFEMIEVTMKYVHYEDKFGVGWQRTPNAFYNLTGQTATITLTSHKAKPTLVERSASGDILFETVTTP